MSLMDLMDRTGLVEGEGSGRSSRSQLDSGVSELRRLRKLTEHEAKHNEIIQERALGQYIVYGDIVSFMHKKSGKFLRVDPSKMAPRGPTTSGLAASLGDEDVMSHFRVSFLKEKW